MAAGQRLHLPLQLRLWPGQQDRAPVPAAAVTRLRGRGDTRSLLPSLRLQRRHLDDVDANFNAHDDDYNDAADTRINNTASRSR